MSLKIKHKRSAVAGSAPTPLQLEDGELAVNYNDTDPAIYLKDSAGAVVKIAGDGAIGGGEWERTGTELSPKTAGDDVFTSGDVKVGGTTGAPNITLNADGSAEIARGNFLFKTDGTAAFSPRPNTGTSLLIQRGGTDTTGSPIIRTLVNGSENFRVESDGAVLVGGTLPSAPNITLNANGSATFAGKISIDRGAVADNFSYFEITQGGTRNTVITADGSAYVGMQTSDINTAKTIISATGSAQFASDVRIGGTLPASPNITLNADGKITAAGSIHIYSSAAPSLRISTDSGGTNPATRAQLGIATAANNFFNGSSSGDLCLTGPLNGNLLFGFGSDGKVAFRNDGSVSIGGALASAPAISLKADGNIQAAGLAAAGRVYADNTAAKAGGLVDGDFYRKADGTLMVTYT